MLKKIKIAFDLDGVIIDKPPIISKRFIERLFRGSKKEILHYKFPSSSLEITIRKLSHLYFLRPALKNNIEFIRKLKKTGEYEIYFITGRYSFLKYETMAWLKHNGVDDLFDCIFMNDKNEQPHLFKERILNLIKPEVFVDDDRLMVDYLSKRSDATRIFYLPYRTKLSEVEILR